MSLFSMLYEIHIQDEEILKKHITRDKLFVLLFLYIINIKTNLDITDNDVATYGINTEPINITIGLRLYLLVS